MIGETMNSKKTYAMLSAIVLCFGMFCGCGDTADKSSDTNEVFIRRKNSTGG